MGCVCCSLSSFISILLDALERISLCTVCAMLVCCLLWTIIVILILGIGIGYHYCFVATNLESMGRAASQATAVQRRKMGGGALPSEMPMTRRAHKHAALPELQNRIRRDADPDTPLTNNKTEQNLTKHVGFTNETSKNFNTSNKTIDLLGHFNITNSTSV